MMRITTNVLQKALLIAGGVFLLISCDKDFSSVGQEVIGGGNYQTEKISYDVFAKQKSASAVRSDSLSVYQLGVYNDPVFGKTKASLVSQLSLDVVNPSFGTYSQSVEDGATTDDSDLTIPEDETVTKVYLNIPYYSTLADTTTTTENDDVARTYKIDSVYGNLNAQFHINVKELTYYLRDLDPNANFEEKQQYFSNQDFSSFTGETLVDADETINNQEIILKENVDDPDTKDVDESQEITDRLSPRIRVEITDPQVLQFFQNKILDAEGTDDLKNNINFKNYLRGVAVNVDVDDNLLMLLDFSNANFDIRYTYKKFNTTTEAVETANGSYQLDFSSITSSTSTTSSTTTTTDSNIKINKFEKEAYPVEITNEINSSDNAANIYLKGGAGTFAEVDLFSADADSTEIKTVLDSLRANKYLINEANLTIYVNRDKISELKSPASATYYEPKRLYLFDMDSSLPIIDYQIDNSTNATDPLLSRYIYGGLAQKDDNGNITSYKFRITEYINDLISEDSDVVFPRLGLSISSNISNFKKVSGMDANGNEVKIPQASIITPVSTILYGPATSTADKKMKLEIYYTKPLD
ncbi:DUF4270 domain-containing protein [Zhouia sp. PK063]|uniref:DUF4270 domain-containing protein n=1 Tax=Zhouia sp. PK063 TaxID=3373602 RepID=UPI00378F1179